MLAQLCMRPLTWNAVEFFRQFGYYTNQCTMHKKKCTSPHVSKADTSNVERIKLVFLVGL